VADNKIVLHPIDPWSILQDPFLLLDVLREKGLIGTAFSHYGEVHYTAGPRFRELVAFKTPPPPPGPEPAHHVSVLETMTDASFLGGVNVQLPQCPHCRARFADWRARLPEWQAARHRYAWVCRKCGRSLRIEQLDWMRTGGVARYALDLWGVREGEGEPTAELLEVLQGVVAEPWTWFYYRL
jgi:hypothetical protein